MDSIQIGRIQDRVYQRSVYSKHHQQQEQQQRRKRQQQQQGKKQIENAINSMAHI